MDVVALDTWKLTALMVAGATFALAGLWLMFRPQPAGEAAKVEMFGLKFQASSAGLVVFVIGAAFLAVQLVVPERVSRPEQDGDVAPASGATATGATAVVLPSEANAAESEPNNYLTEANQIARGVFYAGSIDRERKDPEDWYVLPAKGLEGQDAKIQVRSRSANDLCKVDVLDNKEQLLKNWRMPHEGASNYQSVFVGEAEYLLIRVYNDYNHPCQYELKAD